jgi:hypothetical protein
VLLPSALVFLVLMCNDREVLGPWTNPRWLNSLAVLSIGVMLVLSALLTFTTLFPDIGVAPVALVLGGVLAAVLALLARSTRAQRRPGTDPVDVHPRLTWTMPPLETLEPPTRSRTREIGLVVLRAYLTLAALALLLTTVRSALAG